jgi:hypothetical protein
MQFYVAVAVVALYEMKDCDACAGSVLVPMQLFDITCSLLTFAVRFLHALCYHILYAVLHCHRLLKQLSRTCSETSALW